MTPSASAVPQQPQDEGQPSSIPEPVTQMAAPGHVPDRQELIAQQALAVREEVYRRNNRQLTGQGVQLGQYVRDIYDAGGKLFTKDNFRYLEAQVALDPKPETIMIRSMNGRERHKYVPIEGFNPRCPFLGDLRLTMSFTIIQSLIFNAEEKNLDFDRQDSSRPWTVKPELDDEDKALATRAYTLALSDPRHLDTPDDQLKAAWDESRRNWEQSPLYRDLLETLSNVKCPPNVTKLVCFGLGSLDGSHDYCILDETAKCDGLPLRAAMTQHAAALTMAKVFGEQIGTGPLRIVAQDPAYSPAARRLLTNEGFEVVDGIGCMGFTFVDEDSIVFSVHPDVPVKQIIADLAKPAGMIWDPVRPAEDERTEWEIAEAFDSEMICARGPWTTDEDSARTRAMVEDYDRFDFPHEPERFGRLEMYMLKDEYRVKQ